MHQRHLGVRGGLEPGPRQRWTPDGEGSVEEVLYVAPRRQLVVARSVGPFGVYDVKWGAAVPLRRVEFEAPSERVEPARLFCYSEPTDCLFAFAPTTATLATWSMEERRLLSVVTPHRGGIVGAGLSGSPAPCGSVGRGGMAGAARAGACIGGDSSSSSKSSSP